MARLCFNQRLQNIDVCHRFSADTSQAIANFYGCCMADSEDQKLDAKIGANVTPESREEMAKVTIKLLRDVCMLGGLRLKIRLENHVASELSTARLQEIEKSAKRTDTSKGAMYKSFGVSYYMTLHATDLGYRFIYIP